MKKIIIGLSGILLAALLVIVFVNAKTGAHEVKKSSTEMSKDCAKCPSASACGRMTGAKTAEVKTCDPAKCKEIGCDPAKCKAGKCDPAKCKAICAMAGNEMKKCCPAMGSETAKK